MANNSPTWLTLTKNEHVMPLKWTAQAQNASWAWILLTLCICIATPCLITCVYNLYLHPLRNVPGPKLAALTNFYAFYWNWIRGEGYSKKFGSWHKYYNSPIIRIGPNHVHTTQVEFYDVIFKSGSNWLKEKSFYKYFNGLDAMIEPVHYRTYRTHLAPLYSQRAIDNLAPEMYNDLSISASRMIKMAEAGKVINMTKIMRTLSTSMILRNLYSLDISLYEHDEPHPFLEAFEHIMTHSWLFVTYPLIPMLLGFIPGTCFAQLSSSFQVFLNYCTKWNDDDIRNQQSNEDETARDSHMRRYLAIKDDVKKNLIIPKPIDDVFNFISGGSDTTSYTAACAFFYILSSPTVYAKLQSELENSSGSIRGSFDYDKLKTLPYLNAVIKETLRIAVPVPGCLPRVVPDGSVALGSFCLPAGTSVSISQPVISFNESIFPSSHEFIPERWIGPESTGLDKWNVAFSRGPRHCIGKTLAYLELHCVIAYFFSRFEMTLTGNCGKCLRWVDRYVAVNLDDVEVKILRDRWD